MSPFVVKEFSGYIEVYDNSELVCTVRTKRYTSASESLKAAILDLVAQKLESDRIKEAWFSELSKKMEGTKWIIMS